LCNFFWPNFYNAFLNRQKLQLEAAVEHVKASLSFFLNKMGSKYLFIGHFDCFSSHNAT